MPYDIRVVMTRMEMRLRELMNLIRECCDDAHIMLFIPEGIGEDAMLAQEVQQRIFQEYGTPKSPNFASGNAIDLGWIGIPPMTKLTKLKKGMATNDSRACSACYFGTPCL